MPSLEDAPLPCKHSADIATDILNSRYQYADGRGTPHATSNGDQWLQGALRTVPVADGTEVSRNTFRAISAAHGKLKLNSRSLLPLVGASMGISGMMLTLDDLQTSSAFGILRKHNETRTSVCMGTAPVCDIPADRSILHNLHWIRVRGERVKEETENG
ncbi:hypothetical protein THAOC_00924 [Thalassiosira oceanica]|uniref:Uncharacterized protein n=1 Tax=Thalassiosira oceanica TaxID=159749 RepID=K0TJF4_THAOC|nr:hypothetical protein THAOC_00924 [Thalassiosira oceanica]|eukprot:EJK77254.1 hypothetical protein THAOC_00924 [Thalassiosira oceanica]